MRRQIDLVNKIVVQNLGYEKQPFHVDALTLEYLVEIATTAVYLPRKLGIADMTLIQFLLNELADVDVLVVPVFHYVWPVVNTRSEGHFRSSTIWYRQTPLPK